MYVIRRTLQLRAEPLGHPVTSVTDYGVARQPTCIRFEHITVQPVIYLTISAICESCGLYYECNSVIFITMAIGQCPFELLAHVQTMAVFPYSRPIRPVAGFR